MNGISGWTYMFPPLRDGLREPALMRMLNDSPLATHFDLTDFSLPPGLISKMHRSGTDDTTSSAFVHTLPAH